MSNRKATAPKKANARKARNRVAKKSAGKTSSAKSAKKRAAKRPTPPTMAPSLTAAEKRAIVERYIAAYNARDTAAILTLYAPRATMEDPIGLPAAVGHKAIAGLYQMGFEMGVTIAHDGEVRLAGNAVAFPLVASSPTSRLHVIDVFDFDRSGRIAQMRAYWGPDNLEGDLAVRQ